MASEVEKRGQCVCLAAAELRGHVEDGGGLHLNAVEPTQHLRGEFLKTAREERAFEETRRVDVVFVHGVARRANMIEVDGEFRGVHRSVLAKILARRDGVIPGFQFRHLSSPTSRLHFAQAKRCGIHWLQSILKPCPIKEPSALPLDFSGFAGLSE